jgi:hypothetical protein
MARSTTDSAESQARRHSGQMDVFGTVVNAVLVVLTLAVILFAKQAVTESRKATKAAQDTVSAVKDLLSVSRTMALSADQSAEAASRTVRASEELVEHTRETLDIARVARMADEHNRQVRRLWDIAEVVERAFEKAAAEADYRPQTGWSCTEQRELAPLIVGVTPPLEKCRALAGASQAGLVFSAARLARDEVAERLQRLHAGALGDGQMRD